jgi:maleylpyruvate isomerase
VEIEISRSLADITEATRRLLATSSAMTSEQVREPSLLPGWTRGHVLTHVARNAGGIANLLRSARTGTEIPMYPSRAAREADIEAGAGRSPAELTADILASSTMLTLEAESLPDAAWAATVRHRTGPVSVPTTLLMRLCEVEVHHVDLGLGYQPRDWLEGFAEAQLPRVVAGFAGDDEVPACLLQPDGADPLRLGPGTGPAPVTVSGPGWALLAWLMGRGEGAGLTVDPPGALPVLPSLG